MAKKHSETISGHGLRRMVSIHIADGAGNDADNITHRTQESGAKREVGMAKIRCYVISCSSDSDMDARNLYVWGEQGAAHWLPDSAKEVKRRIDACRRQHDCQPCDAEVHEIVVERTLSTKSQTISDSTKPSKESTT